ncbi:WhiB family transcriptional regulator [Streptomyces sp. ME02-6991-2B]|nr:WhiB family transcriptional regulator [Streptomyces sp. ME02-6991-2B]
MTDWRTLAACRDHDPELWFPDPTDYDTRRAAVTICRTCPVIAECLTFADTIRARDGIFGGRDVAERLTARRRQMRADRHARDRAARTTTEENHAA